MSKCNFVAIDFETANTDRFPCQLGIVVVRNGEITERREFLIKPPENKYSQSCIRVHKITPNDTYDCMEFPDLWPEIKEYLRNELIVAHNISFDFDVLDKVVEYYNLDYVPMLGVRCTCRLYKDKKLSVVAEAIGIEYNKAHNALCDAEVCAKVFLAHLLDGVDPDTLVYPDNDRKKKKVIPQFNDETRNLSSEVKKQDLSIVENENNYFFDKKVVISGVFDRFPIREDLALSLKKYGADINTSISRKTDIFIIGNDFGPSKFNKVLKLKDNGCEIEILEAFQLYQILDNIK